MAISVSTAKLTELPPHMLPTIYICRRKPPHFPIKFFKPLYYSLSSTNTPGAHSENFKITKTPPSSWIKKWPSPPPPPPPPPPRPKSGSRKPEPKTPTVPAGTTAIDRIVLRLRNLGLGSDEDEKEEEYEGGESELNFERATLTSNDHGNAESGDAKLGDLLKRNWVRPDTILMEEADDGFDSLLPWERGGKEDVAIKDISGGANKRAMRAPTLAELTIEDEELRRLRRMGMTLRERINVPKAGLTGAILENIHEKWRRSELVRLKFHEELAHDMMIAHEIVERRTGGLVTWRSGSVMVVFRGTNYEGPISKLQRVDTEDEARFVPNVTSSDYSAMQECDSKSRVLEKPNPVTVDRLKRLSLEEAEFNTLLDGLGPRFEDWWGMGVLPVDADLLSPTIPGYKTPFRFFPTGMRSRLTNAEMTNMRKLAKSIPCHFALGRNRNHQGLANSIIKLWENSLLVKIAVKRGIQNTNNKIMAEELKKLTGGVLLLRNKYYIVMYRGKDFLHPAVATALSERQEVAKQIQDVEEKVRVGTPIAATPRVGVEEQEAEAGTLTEFYKAQSRWGYIISDKERERMIEEASRAKHAKVIRRLERKVAIAQAKKLRAEKLLSKIVDSWVPVKPSDDQETLTDEERIMYHKVGLRMRAYLPLGIRGIFDGVIENMHLHWKHRELVKLISKEKEWSFAEETARLLEHESGGILVAIDRVPKGHILIYYRGKNYRRPITLRPSNLLTKAKALKRRVALQRYEALSLHISELENIIEQTKQEIGDSGKLKNAKLWTSDGDGPLNSIPELDESEDDIDESLDDEVKDDTEWKHDKYSNISSVNA